MQEYIQQIITFIAILFILFTIADVVLTLIAKLIAFVKTTFDDVDFDIGSNKRKVRK
ncbi:hypothetical protein [Anaerotalea alkaliphila]|uniref:Uncharacterized protein n=1 Tax=Anaerotalea alkaliphila TaxID=2662126 RepID=A0A7X5HW26_9FIRM|nr:hypothetical protein [Anaerotalea alkaliphila]NDL67704.1 hypothetical protein [Anaerotalea alkaliphila]